MDTFIHADIFFFVTTIVLVVFAAFGVILLIYSVKIVRTVSDIANTIKTESKNIAEDIESIREQVKEKGSKLSVFTGLIGKALILKPLVRLFTSRRDSKGKK
jgi:predicted PurR-regulated permease PerM